MTEASETAAVPRLPALYRLVAFDRIDSTNEEARRLAAAGAAEGTLIWARRQLSGRGRQGRDWDSPSGNLYLSLLLRPACSAQEAAQLGFVTALALGDAVAGLAMPMITVTYKWPNDVLFNDRKGAGILLESSLDARGNLDWLVIGMGVNVVSHPAKTRAPATSLRAEGAPVGVTAVHLLEAFAETFQLRLTAWRAEGFAPVRQAWLDQAAGLGQIIEARLPRERLVGSFENLDGEGALLLALEQGGQRRITAGEIYFQGQAPCC